MTKEINGVETSLDCCKHTFCYACIKSWIDGGKRNNKCPLCKKVISKITYIGQEGKQKSEDVAAHDESSDYGSSDYDSEEIMPEPCEICDELIYESELVDGEAVLEFCDRIGEVFVHMRCMTSVQREIFEKYDKYYSR